MKKLKKNKDKKHIKNIENLNMGHNIVKNIEKRKNIVNIVIIL